MKMGKFKKFVALALAALTTMAMLTACGGGNNNDEEGDLLTRIKSRGKIVVGMNAEFAPYEFHAIVDGKDTILGFDIDLAQAIADDLGVELEIKEMEFDALISGLEAGQCDILISALAMKEERKQQVDFSIGYYYGKNVLLMNKDNTSGMDSVADLADKKIGIQMASTQQILAEAQLEPIGTDVTYISSMNTLLASLNAGQIDGIVTDELVSRTMAASNPNLVVNETLEFVESEDDAGTGVAIPKGETALKEAIDKTVQRLLDSGELQEFINKACEDAAKNASTEED